MLLTEPIIFFGKNAVIVQAFLRGIAGLIAAKQRKKTHLSFLRHIQQPGILFVCSCPAIADSTRCRKHDHLRGCEVRSKQAGTKLPIATVGSLLWGEFADPVGVKVRCSEGELLLGVAEGVPENPELVAVEVTRTPHIVKVRDAVEP